MKHAERTQHGFSLIELMLALGLGAIVTAGIVQLFVQNNQTYALLNGQSRMQESAAYALDFIGRAIRTSGYIGCAPEQDKVELALRGTWNDLYEFNILEPIEGYEGNADGTWTPALTELPRTVGGADANVYVAGNGVPIDQVVPQTDVLVMRRIAEPGQRLLAAAQPTADPVVTAPGGDPGFGVDDIVLIADCQQASVFRVTGLTIAGTQATVAHAVDASASPFVNGSATISAINEPYSREAVIGLIETQIFYVAPSAGTNNLGNTPDSLWWKVGTNAPVELIQGVSDLQVRYGFDSDGDGRANQYVRRNGLADVDGDTFVTDEAVTLRVELTIDSVDAVTEDFGGGGARVPLERVFTQTFFLRNRGI
jgi:type IV pilus assembly protein PilW